MKLDRNLNPDGHGKYTLVLMREIPQDTMGRAEAEDRLDDLNHMGCLDYGEAPDNEFFVIRLRDKCASAALRAYAHEAAKFDPEYATEITILADRAANHPRQKQPD